MKLDPKKLFHEVRQQQNLPFTKYIDWIKNKVHSMRMVQKYKEHLKKQGRDADTFEIFEVEETK